jgi:hypothetical protein
MGVNLSKHRFIICDGGRNSQQLLALDRGFFAQYGRHPGALCFHAAFFDPLSFSKFE